jgi:DNA repair exonuclease SbcCD ATPase subunit
MTVKVRVQNFQSIEDASIEIKGLTVITGTNNAGKSALFRAIKGALCNTPGTDFVRIGASHCRVDLEFDDGQNLSWEKGKNLNTYTINGKPFPKVGRGRPEELEVFGVEPITVGDDTLWPQIASQFKVTFLLDKTGSAIADAVADVDRVNKLNKALKSCESDRRKVKSTLKVRRSDNEALQQKRLGFEGLDAELSNLKEIEERWKKADKFSKALQNLHKLADRWGVAKDAVSFFKDFESAASGLPSGDSIEQLTHLKASLEGSRKLKDEYQEALATVSYLLGVEDVEQGLPSEERVLFANKFRQALGVTVDLATRYQEAKDEFDLLDGFRGHDLDDTLTDKANKFKQVIHKAVDLQTRLETSRKDNLDIESSLLRYQEELISLEEQLSSILGTFEECPTCGSGLGHTHHP